MMAKNKCDFKQLTEFTKKIEQLSDTKKDEFLQACAKELAARLLAKVVKRTPVGQYPKGSGMQGGTLRRGWTGGKSAKSYADNIDIKHVGNTYKIDIINPVKYASYVEYGHRTANHQGWVQGQFMLTISEEEINQSSQAILQRKLNKFLKEVAK